MTLCSYATVLRLTFRIHYVFQQSQKPHLQVKVKLTAELFPSSVSVDDVL